MRAVIALIAWLAIAIPTHAGNVLVVAPSGAPYANLQAAVDAAHDGDIVLVKTGNYLGFVVANASANKSLSVVADNGQSVHLGAPVQLFALDPSRDVLLSGLQIDVANRAGNAGLTATGCSGSIRVQSCQIQGGEHAAGVSIQNSSDVSLVDTMIIGGNGTPGLASLDPNANGAIGVTVSGASIALYECTVDGGTGAPTNCFGGAGGDGLQAFSTYAFAASSAFAGGHGANAQNHCFANCKYCVCGGGNGGNGVTLLPSTASSRSRLDAFTCDLEGGDAGFSGQNVMGCCGFVSTCDGDPADPGTAISVGTADVYEPIGGTLPLFTVSQNPVRERSTVTLRFAGQPGDEVFLVASSETSFTPSMFNGVQLIPSDSHTYVTRVGILGTNGILELTRRIPDLRPGTQGEILYMQSMHKSPAGSFTLGNLVSLVILDQTL